MKNIFKAIILPVLVLFTFFTIVYFSLFLISCNNSEQLRNKYDNEETEKVESISIEDVTAKIKTLKALIDNYYYKDVNEEQLFDMMYHGLLYGLGDPYSCYYNEEEYEDLKEESSGEYSGIGMQTEYNVQTGEHRVYSIYEDSPADKSGLKVGDLLLEIDDVPVKGLDLKKVGNMVRGQKGTVVKFLVEREGLANPTIIRVIRDEISKKTVHVKILDNNIGYIALTEFDTVTRKQFIQAVNDMAVKNVDGLILDVRDNGGGLYDVVLDVLDRLVDTGLLVYTEDKYGVKEEKYAVTSECFDKPMAVLINENTASASEIFAGALQDKGLAVVVGTQSFGKGIVQSVLPLEGGKSAVKITTSRYFTPNGVCIHGIGITPDIKVELDKKYLNTISYERETDNQLEAAIEAILKKVNK